jgi:hypothetical protein
MYVYTGMAHLVKFNHSEFHSKLRQTIAAGSMLVLIDLHASR